MPSTLFLAMGESWFGHGEYIVEEMWYKEWHYCVKGQFQTQWLHHYQGKPILQGLHTWWAAYHTGRGGECYLRKSWVSESLGRLFISLEIFCVFSLTFDFLAWPQILGFSKTGLGSISASFWSFNSLGWSTNGKKMLPSCIRVCDYVWNVKPC